MSLSLDKLGSDVPNKLLTYTFEIFKGKAFEISLLLATLSITTAFSFSTTACTLKGLQLLQQHLIYISKSTVWDLLQLFSVW